jgi:hypothetical protein
LISVGSQGEFRQIFNCGSISPHYRQSDSVPKRKKGKRKNFPSSPRSLLLLLPLLLLSQRINKKHHTPRPGETTGRNHHRPRRSQDCQQPTR